VLGILLEQIQERGSVEPVDALLHARVEGRGCLGVEVVRKIRARDEQRTSSLERPHECVGERVDRLAML
jgi:hypothetical protein